MTRKLSDISSWQFVFWDNGRYLLSLQQNISMLCMFTSWRIVWHHASQTAKYLFSSNLGWISFIKPSLNLPFSHLYRLLSESWSVWSVLLFSSKAFLVASQWRNNNFHFSRIEVMRPQAMMELYLFLKNNERHILEGNPLKYKGITKKCDLESKNSHQCWKDGMYTEIVYG